MAGAKGRAVETGAAIPQAKAFTASPKPSLIRDFDGVMASLGKSARMVDARSAGRFTGAEAEPRAGVRGGHMPGAANHPFPQPADSGGQYVQIAGRTARDV